VLRFLDELPLPGDDILDRLKELEIFLVRQRQAFANPPAQIRGGPGRRLFVERR
jgi:hypothetical protein